MTGLYILDEFDAVDGVRQLAEALQRASDLWSEMTPEQRTSLREKGQVEEGDRAGLAHFKSLMWLVLHGDSQPLALLIGPSAERVTLERATLEQAYSESESTLELCREAYRGMREDVQVAAGMEQKLTYIQLLDYVRGLAEDRLRFGWLMRHSHYSRREEIDACRERDAAVAETWQQQHDEFWQERSA